MSSSIYVNGGNAGVKCVKFFICICNNIKLSQEI